MNSILPTLSVLLIMLIGPGLKAQRINQTTSGAEAAAVLTEPTPLPATQPFELYETHPSHHTGVLNIEFDVRVAGHYVISAVGAHGRDIESIAEKYFEKGNHQLNWMVSPGAHYINMYYAHHDGMPYFQRLLIIKY